MSQGRAATQHGLWRDALLVFVLPLALYAATAPRMIMPEDDGLFILAAYFMGVAHPPGYPLFVLLAHPFSWLPFDSIAFRIHLASSVFASLAVLAAWWTMVALPGVTRLGALTSALALALSATFWSQAIIAEVYCLNAALFLLLLGLSVRYLQCLREGRESSYRLHAIALVLGVGLTNHWPLMILGSTGLAVMFLPAWRQLLRSMPTLAVLVCLGLLPYLWLYLRSRMAIPVSFYGPLDPDSFWFMLSRQGYADVDQSQSAQLSDKVGFAGFFLRDLVTQFGVPGTIFGGLGFTLQWRHWPRTLALGLTVSFLASSVLLAMLLGFDYSKYFRAIFRAYPIVANAIWAVWMALGTSAVLMVLHRALGSFAWRRHYLSAGCVVFLAYLGASHAALNDRHSDDLADRYARAVLNTLPQNAVVFVSGDMSFGPLAYTHILGGVRPDLTLYNPLGLILGNRLFDPIRGTEEWHIQTIADFVQKAEQPVCVVGDWTYGFAFEESWLFRCLRKDAPPGDNTFRLYPEQLPFLSQLLHEDTRANPWLSALRDGLLYRMGQMSTYMIYGREGEKASEAVQEANRRILDTDYGRLGALNMLLRHVDPGLSQYASLARTILSALAPDDARFELKEDRALALYLAGLTHEVLGESQEALADYILAMDAWLDPANAAAIKLLNRLDSDPSALDSRLADWLLSRREKIMTVEAERQERGVAARDAIGLDGGRSTVPGP